MTLPKTNKIRSREELILEAIRDCSVLHIGCSDSPFTEYKLKNRSLLHMRMLSICKSVDGIDMDTESIDLMKSKGITNIYNLDIYNINTKNELSNEQYNYVVLSEVIEHLPDPGRALKEIYKFCRNKGPDTKLIITAPNINSYTAHIVDYIKNEELVHPDHYFYFSYKTLRKLIENSGFHVLEFQYSTYGLSSFFQIPARLLNYFSSSFMPCLFFKLSCD